MLRGKSYEKGPRLGEYGRTQHRVRLSTKVRVVEVVKLIVLWPLQVLGKLEEKKVISSPEKPARILEGQVELARACVQKW